MAKIKKYNLRWFGINHLAKKNITAGGGSSRATTRKGNGFRVRDVMPSAEGLGIYASFSPLFAKLKNCKAQLPNRWIGVF